jgi:hypothetical protein
MNKKDDVLNVIIDELFADVPLEHKTDFQKKMQCPTRDACLSAMDDYAAVLLRAERIWVLEQIEKELLKEGVMINPEDGIRIINRREKNEGFKSNSQEGRV